METNKTINEKWQVRFDGMSIYTTTAKGLSLIATTETKHLFHVGLNQAKHNAERIVECVNNYDALKEENERLKTALKKLIDTATETTSDLIAFDGAAQLDNAIDFATNVLNQSTVKEDGNNEKQAL